MGSTITEKILARAAGRDEVDAGDIIEAKVDLVLANDITAPLGDRRVREGRVHQGLRPGPHRPGARPLHAQQGHQGGGPGQEDARVRPQARDRQLLRGRAHGHRARAAARHGHGGAGRRRHRRRQPHLHLRRRGRVQHRRRQHRLRRRHGLGPASGCACPRRIKFVYSGTPGPWVSGKDLMLHTIGLIGVDGALYQAMEFTGEAIEA